MPVDVGPEASAFGLVRFGGGNEGVGGVLQPTTLARGRDRADGLAHTHNGTCPHPRYVKQRLISVPQWPLE